MPSVLRDVLGSGEGTAVQLVVAVVVLLLGCLLAVTRFEQTKPSAELALEEFDSCNT
jgi:hypothetical protein